jgi:hypothetical protein
VFEWHLDNAGLGVRGASGEMCDIGVVLHVPHEVGVVRAGYD